MSVSESQPGHTVVCLGAGGHAAVVVDALSAAGRHTVAGLLDSDPGRRGESVLGHPILGDDSMLPELVGRGVTGFIVAFDGVGRAAARARAYERAVEAGLEPVSVVHPSASVAASSAIGRGVTIMAGVVVNARASAGDNAILNSGCILEHDCAIGAHTHVAPGAVVLGGVTVGEAVHVGAGAVVHEGLEIGARAVIGAGAVVIRSVKPDQTVVGVPAAARSGL